MCKRCLVGTYNKNLFRFTGTAAMLLAFIDAASARVLHRYSFNGDLSDSVGGATAVFGGDGGAFISEDGQLDVTSNPLLYGWADLPIQASMQANITNEVSYEFWYQVDELNAYHRLFIS